MYLQHPLLTGFRSWQDQCETSRYEVFPGSPQGCEHQSYSRMPSYPQRLRTSNSFKGCLIVVCNFRPHVVWAKRLAKLKRLTDFISKYFWAKIKELRISDRLSVIFPKKRQIQESNFCFQRYRPSACLTLLTKCVEEGPSVSYCFSTFTYITKW